MYMYIYMCMSTLAKVTSVLLVPRLLNSLKEFQYGIISRKNIVKKGDLDDSHLFDRRIFRS